ncbi:YihY/virulence factor BrkB family protein [Algivirga pacifica]|uniref:YihY/virulence factor BrkB family protein n=1 Tax=Algivirga pacifica TaxID=1162670 RepID=A0ABP9D780_9BACT
MSTLNKWLSESKVGESVVEYLKSIRFKSVGASLYSIINVFLYKLDQDDTLQRAQAVAFNFTLAILPTIIFIFTLIPYLPIDGFDQMIFDFLKEMIPTYVMESAQIIIEDIISRPRSGLMSFGFVLATYMATSGMRSLMDAFNSCCSQQERRSIWKLYSIALLLTFLLAFTLFSAIILLIYGKVILTFLVKQGFIDTFFVYYLIYVLRFIVMIFLMFLNTATIYYFAPTQESRWKMISPGSVIATVLGVTVSSIFSVYLENFNTYNKLYGSIGAVIGVMFWLLAISYVLLLGYQVNSALDMTKEQMQQKQKNHKKIPEYIA